MAADPDEAAAREVPEKMGGDPVCWAAYVCQECGAMTTEGHRPGCPAASDREP